MSTRNILTAAAVAAIGISSSACTTAPLVADRPAITASLSMYWSAELSRALAHVQFTNPLASQLCMPSVNKSEMRANVELSDEHDAVLRNPIAADTWLQPSVPAEVLEPQQSADFAFELRYQFHDIRHGQRFKIRYRSWAFECSATVTRLYPYPPLDNAAIHEIDSGWIEFVAP